MNMEKALLIIITIYQQVISPILKQAFGLNAMCRYSPSCSEYTKQVIKKYGMIRGLKLAVFRILSCQPWGLKYGTNI